MTELNNLNFNNVKNENISEKIKDRKNKKTTLILETAIIL